MKLSSLSPALFWLVEVVIGVEQHQYTILEPLARHAWDHEFRISSNLADHLQLRQQEQFMWTCNRCMNGSGSATSVVAYTRQDERIVDIDRFSYALDSVVCTIDCIKLTFRNRLFFQAAKAAWEWVNFSKLRTFVLVLTGEGCSSADTRDPWVVSDATFDPDEFIITLQAQKNTWKLVCDRYILDFGDIDTGQGRNQKRLFDWNFNVFTLNLTTSLPTEIVHWNLSNPNVDASLAIDCNDCGTKGTLAFAGHVEVSLFGDLEHFQLSATPRGIEGDLNLSLAFHGDVDFDGLPAVGQEWTLVTFPLPSGWKFPGILQFGPHVQINAGWNLDYISGDAMVSTGITARIPDSAIAEVDFASKKPVKIWGWTPQIDTLPLEVQAQIDAQARLYTEIAVGTGITVLDEDGINVEVGLRVPEVTVTAAAGYNEQGFCPNDPKPWGLTLDASIGASLDLQGYTELNGEKKVFLDVTLFQTPALYTFPELCLSMGDISPGACIPQVGPQDPDDEYVAPGQYPDPPPARRRRRAVTIPEDDSSKDPKRFFYVGCDQQHSHAIFIQKYPGPPTLKKDKNVPIIQPLMNCSMDDCPPSTWNVQVATDPSAVTKKGWASEHVYEGNWIQAFLNYLKETYYTSAAPGSNDTQCNGEMDTFGIQRDITTPNPTLAFNYTEALMQNLATTYTASRLMALLPQKQNNLKYLMFAGSNIDGTFEADRTYGGSPNTHEKRVCSIGRLVTVCKYMDHDRIIPRLNDTITGIEGILAIMDNDITIDKPDALKSKTFKTAHAEFFDKHYRDGFDNARRRLKDYSTWLQKQPGFDALSAEKKQAVADVAAHPEQYCEGKFRR
ncbi:hypothetical protein FE257_002472 [Aspergillus nanangensis]|uniref:Uncharacterized protein n=1 Tax=Aspergillus nanangensis TaxID=2582783 RepID=A0AAD4CST4_ASPNN|nr:hypothetical protein FE257_002472 [Aspergillus nanangensis]